MRKINFFLAFLCLSLLLSGQQEINAQEHHTQHGEPFDQVPKGQDVAIYQVNIRSFSKEGTLKAVEDRLDEIKALGVNVVYLMPIYPVGQVRSAGGLGSPYAVKDYKAVNPDFGTLEDLRSLVAEAHKRGLAVLLDWVPNHTSWDNAWITEHKDWYQQDSLGNIIIPPTTNWQDVAQLDYTNPELRQEMIDALQYWVRTANIDGYRFDAANWVPFDFWKQAVDSLRAIDGRQLLLLAEGDREDHMKAGFDFTFGFNFFYTLKDQIFHEKKPASLVEVSTEREYANALHDSQRVVRYVSNHDVNIYEGTPMELFGGKKGAMATFIVAAYMKGVPMIYNGQEIGYAKRLEFFNRTPIDWTAADQEVLAEYKKVLGFYNNSEAIRKGQLKAFSNEDVVAFTKELAGDKALVLSNLRNKAVTFTLPADVQKQKGWKDAFSGKKTILKKQVTLQPFEYLVLQN